MWYGDLVRQTFKHESISMTGKRVIKDTWCVFEGGETN